MARAPIASAVMNDILTRSGRRCAFCFGLDGSLARKKGQIAHVDRNNENAAVENLAWLCFEHHDEYDSKTSQSKGLIPGELIIYRDRLYECIARGEHHATSQASIGPRKVPAEVIEHDRAVFRASDALLSESTLRDTLDGIGADHSYRMREMSRLEDLVAFFRLESNRFLLDDLNAPAQELADALTALDAFVTQHFFDYPRHQQRDHEWGTRYCMQPEWNIDRGGSGKPEETRQYSALASQLFATLNSARDAYVEYRRSVKRNLLL